MPTMTDVATLEIAVESMESAAPRKRFSERRLQATSMPNTPLDTMDVLLMTEGELHVAIRTLAGESGFPPEHTEAFARQTALKLVQHREILREELARINELLGLVRRMVSPTGSPPR
ncbi:MAG: hypothetical protein HYY93_07865 [Planctomycetes bacterium]|nr:hypothetical protein [Planctomycetota bacterium]